MNSELWRRLRDYLKKSNCIRRAGNDYILCHNYYDSWDNNVLAKNADIPSYAEKKSLGAICLRMLAICLLMIWFQK